MSRSKEVVHFLNELGWLFQRKCSSSFESRDFKIIRFKFLLIFSVEHDFCALVKTLLDILLEINLAMKGLENESLQMLLELQLLSRAVKRKCKDMVDLLINFSVSVPGHNLKYIFLPNLPGPGGITPLHLAACTANSDDVVDSLTSDPQEIGLRCWNSLLDENALSPNAYALMRNNHSYNNLVSQKLANRENGHVSVSIGGEIDQLEMDEDHNKQAFQVDQAPKSCSKCAAAAMRHSRRGVPGSQGLLYRPYIHSMLAIAAVCACVCVFFRGAPDIGSVAPFKWENLDFGPL
nr:squamosa promoter-binding-like protein 14 [Ipomoea batatas]